MSTITKLRMQAWEKAYWHFATADYTDKQCEFYAKQFEQYVLESMSERVNLDDLLAEFVSDLSFAEQAEAEKERGRYA